jgi:hypothetical protein
VVGCLAAVPTMLRIVSRSTHGFLPKQVLVMEEQWECALHEGNIQCGRDRDSGLRAWANETRRCTATPSLDITRPSSHSHMLEAKYTRACGNFCNNVFSEELLETEIAEHDLPASTYYLNYHQM